MCRLFCNICFDLHLFAHLKTTTRVLKNEIVCHNAHLCSFTCNQTLKTVNLLTEKQENAIAYVVIEGNYTCFLQKTGLTENTGQWGGNSRKNESKAYSVLNVSLGAIGQKEC